MTIANVGLRFDNGKVVGRWDIPSPQTRPIEFQKVAEDIGWHIAWEIAHGAEGCFFINMNEEEKRRSPAVESPKG